MSVSRKRSHSPDPTEKVAAHYNTLPCPTIQSRKQSLIYHLRCFSNWVKAVLIQTHIPPRANVLDLGCGRGGDLSKYHRAGVRCVYGFDVASSSIQEAKDRCNSAKHFRFKAHFQVADCFNHSIDSLLPPDLQFDAVCLQFCIHYAFSSEASIRQTLANISSRLRPGGVVIGCTTHAHWLLKRALTSAVPGTFGNALYSVRFPTLESTSPYGCSYVFDLLDAVSCPEYLIHWPTLVRLARDYQLTFEARTPFHEFYRQHERQHRDLLLRMDVLNAETPHMPRDEWEALGVYTTFVFRKDKA